MTNIEVDGTVGDYMELIIQFGFLNLFAMAFPASFLIAFFTNIVEI
jgi:anoctamin-10